MLEEQYGQQIDDTLTAERVMLLDAIIAGDLDGIRALTQMSWDFVYPPAYVDPLSGGRDLEAWCGHACTWRAARGRPGAAYSSLFFCIPLRCMHTARTHTHHTHTHAPYTHTHRCRTPLCLLVRPDEGNFDSKMKRVPEADRQALLQPLLHMVAGSTTHSCRLYYTWLQSLTHGSTLCCTWLQALLQDVLSIGCADPNYPQIYWSSPAMHASFEGDLDALETLRLNGCDLRQKFEWVLQEEPRFSLVHAAAFNGQEAVLRYLRTLYPPSFMRELDATGSNALHVTLESSRDLGTARFLLEQSVDGFAFNQAGRSPLSISIECLPELALVLLKAKSRFEYRWWGNDLFWFSFDGIILPLQVCTHTATGLAWCGTLRLQA